MMIVDNKFKIGERVYLATDPEQLVRIVSGIMVRQGTLIYELSCGERATNAYDFEISSERDTVLATS